jgi:hypothetical protein
VFFLAAIGCGDDGSRTSLSPDASRDGASDARPGDAGDGGARDTGGPGDDGGATDSGGGTDATTDMDSSMSDATPEDGDPGDDAMADAETDAGTPAARINEFVANHTGMDINEYVEILSDPDTSLASYRLVVIEGDGGGANRGLISAVFTGGTTDGSGYWTTGLLANGLQNGTQVLLLVAGFSSTLDTDLDEDDDGVLDATPWASVVDAVAVTDSAEGAVTYGFPTLPSVVDGENMFAVGGASRIPDGMDTDEASDWVSNDFNGAGLPDGMFSEVIAPTGMAINTPGAPNMVQE